MKIYSLILFIYIFGLFNSNYFFDIYDIKLSEELTFEEVDDSSGFYFRINAIDNTNKSIQLKVLNDQNLEFRIFVIGFNEFPTNEVIYNSLEYIELSSLYSKSNDSLFNIYDYPISITSNSEYLVFYVETPIYLNFLSISVNPDELES